MEENRRRISIAASREAEGEEEERGAAAAASTLVGPARRSLRRWARPAPYAPSPRRFISDFLSKPSPPIRSLMDTATPRASLPPPRHDRASGSALGLPDVSGTGTREVSVGNEVVAVDGHEVAEIERLLKARTFSRDEADRLLRVLRSRTPALNGVTTLQSEPKQSGLLAHQKITWKAGDSVYSKANALGCTPIDIAKAYMRDLSSSRVGSSYQTKTSPVAENATEKNGSGTNLRICWPGADLPGNSSSYRTPQQSKGNTVQDATPSRTPYADSPFSRSIFKVKNDRDSCDLFSTGKKRRLTTSDGAKNQKAKLQDDMPFRIVDPETDRENMLTTFTQRGASPINRSQQIPQSSLERKGKNEVALNGPSSLWTHNRKSTETAQKILSHLERAIPSSSEKPPLHRQISREVPSGSLLMNNKKTESLQPSGNSNQKMPDVNEDGGAAKSNATTTKKNSDTGVFGFTFPVTAVNTSSSEPPPTPTMPSPHLLPVSVNVPEVPDFSFGSSNSLSSRLVFSFDSSDNASTILEEPPTYKFGSGEERISFAFPDEDGAICC